MPKANITLPDGTTVQVEGSAQEVAKLMALYAMPKATKAKATAARSPKKSAGPLSHAVGLVDESFFDEPKDLKNVREKLEELGHIYENSDLSPTMLRLVKKKVLRRVRVDGVWKYKKA